MNIRLEQPQDWREVENLTREAFLAQYASNGRESVPLGTVSIVINDDSIPLSGIA